MALALVIGLLGLLLVVLARGVELWTVACAFALIGLIVVGYKSKRGRRVLLGREVTTLVFASLAVIFIWRICNSKESWYTVPTSEEEVPVWNGSWRRDPGGEKVVFSMLATMFLGVAALPWLPSGNRYYRRIKASV